MSQQYQIAIIAKHVDKNVQNEFTFYFDGDKYEHNLKNIKIKQLINDVNSVTQFQLKKTTFHYNENIYLSLFFIPSIKIELPEKYNSKYRILNTFFDINNISTTNHSKNNRQIDLLTNEDEMELIQPTQPTSTSVNDNQHNENNSCDEEMTNYNNENLSSETRIQNFYSLLRDYHLNDNCPERLSTNKTILNKLIPILRSYQTKAVNWMLDRELNLNYLPSKYFEIYVKSNSQLPQPLSSSSFQFDSTAHFYYNAISMDITDTWPGDKQSPTGGILADEMGLGKTVEMLALILSNKKKKLKESYSEKKLDVLTKNVVKNVDRILCLCSSRRKSKMIKCCGCKFYQHIKCVVDKNTKVTNLNSYHCPNCWKSMKTINSGTTLIVSPSSIKMQWQDEIYKCVGINQLKVLVYSGLKKTGWIDPHELASYDIVLTDYNTMKTEIYFTDTDSQMKRSTSLRNKPIYINPVSPLTKLKWWRVCLDEAQMIEVPVNQSSKMVKMLSTVHRWSVTGTPIEKSIHNLYGLLYFMDYEPYTDLSLWNPLTDEFENGNPLPLVNVFGKIMWRTCKINVEHEIGIPPQKEIIHSIVMSDLQALFYNSQHSACADKFNEKAAKLGKSLSMFNMNSHTLKLIMEPLRKLRQDCSIPTIFNKTEQSQTKKLLSPEELHVHMVNANEIECKSELRSIVSSLNGIAALYIIIGNFELAIQQYKTVLRWAKDYTGVICVDSLLQVHALHNLLEILPITTDTNDYNTVYIDEKQNYKSQLAKLEWKYMENCNLLVKKIENQKFEAENTISSLVNKLNDENCTWWINTLNDLDLQKELNIIGQINAELSSNYSDGTKNGFKSIDSIKFVLFEWLNKVDTTRQQLKESFDELRFFSDNIKPRDQWPTQNILDIEHLIVTAFECHLNLLSTTEETNNKSNKKPKTTKKNNELCKLCQVKNLLNTYECIIFDKAINKITTDINQQRTIGSWKLTHQEVMLKFIYGHLKKDQPNNSVYIQDGEIHLNIIDAIKNEFKEYSKLWVEINYTVGAYDELNMCKSRLKAGDPEELKFLNKATAKLFISNYEIDSEMENFQYQIQHSTTMFLRLQGTLKYLKHLKTNSGECDICPICKQLPEKKYCVLECGHHMCIECLTNMAKFYKTILDCSVCRHKQKYKDLYYVTCKESSNENETDYCPVKGNYSKKIETIIRTILKLWQQDNKIKIIIFSHWETILNVIGKALEENSIEYRTKSTQFHRCIHDFKSDLLNITCLLLPLSLGSKGLNLTEATHVFLVEPILNPAEELQAIGRVHRIGQIKQTFVHRFIVKNTIEETIHQTISNDLTGKWKTKEVTVQNLAQLFTLNNTTDDVEIL